MGYDRIDITHPKWRALRIEGVESIEYLQRMFAQGWYIPPIGLDDVSYMVMAVPATTPKRINFTNEHQILEAEKQPYLTVIGLHKGKHPDRQMVVVLPRNESGYSVKADDQPPYKLWKLAAMLTLEDGTLAHVFEQRIFDSE